MTLLISDTALIDPMLEETLHWRGELSEYGSTADLLQDGYEYEAGEPSG
jgi:hypothetical protein